MSDLNSNHTKQQDSKNTANSELSLPLIENQKFSDEQNQEIRLGIEEGLNVSIYAKAEYNWLQMEQIRMGLKDKVDVSAYADPAYSYDTMKQIRLAFYSSTDLTPYLDRGFIDDELEQIRLALEDKLPFEFLNGRIVITNMIVVREDVTAVTGKLEVDGSVYVIGSVHSGGYIKATGDIIVEYNVETAKLIAGGNIMIKKGSCSKRDCFIEADGEVSGSFFEAANINARGNVKANYIMNSNIRTMGRVIVSGTKGILLGGSICAVKGVDTYNLGNSSHIKTLLDVGRNELYAKEQLKLEERREAILSALSALEEGWNKMLLLLPAKKEFAEENLVKLNATIVAKDRELANLDAEISKLANMTEQDMKSPVCVRGSAYPGSIIVINSIKYMLPSEISHIIFKLRNKTVVMAKL